MTLEQKISEALLSTIHFENKESIQLFTVPKLKEICIELAREAYDAGCNDGALLGTNEWNEYAESKGIKQ